MIQIDRVEEPPSLTTSNAQDRYSHQAVVDVLWRMQYRKCCYCERGIERTGTEKEVEHFRPRADYKDLTNDWSNLLLACRPCNQKKKRHFPVHEHGDPLLIDPSDDAIDPEDKLEFVTDLDAPNSGSVHARGGSRRGQVTVEVIGLAGATHITRRVTQLKELNIRYVDLILASLPDGDSAVLCQERERFEALLSARSPFAAFAREFARAKKLDDKFGIRIPVGSATGD